MGFLLSLFIVLTISFSIQSLPGNQNQELQDNYLFYVMHHGRFQYKTEYFDWRFWDETKRPDSKDYQNWKKSVIDLSNKAKKDSVLLTDIYKEWLIKDAINNPFNIVIQAFIRVHGLCITFGQFTKHIFKYMRYFWFCAFIQRK